MRQYYYQKNDKIYGPYTTEEILTKKLSRNTYVWYEGLDTWIPFGKSILADKPRLKNKTRNTFLKKLLLIIVMLAVFGLTLRYLCITDPNGTYTYNKIKATSYDDPNTDFSVYLEGFYNDIDAFNIVCSKSSNIIIKLADLTTINSYGVSFGMNDNSKIEIYIDASFWYNANEAEKYWILYHELCHDVLNIDHTADTPANKNTLMYPNVDITEIYSLEYVAKAAYQTFFEYAIKKGYYKLNRADYLY